MPPPPRPPCYGEDGAPALSRLSGNANAEDLRVPLVAMSACLAGSVALNLFLLCWCYHLWQSRRRSVAPLHQRVVEAVRVPTHCQQHQHGEPVADQADDEPKRDCEEQEGGCEEQEGGIRGHQHAPDAASACPTVDAVQTPDGDALPMAGGSSVCAKQQSSEGTRCRTAVVDVGHVRHTRVGSAPPCSRHPAHGTADSRAGEGAAAPRLASAAGASRPQPSTACLPRRPMSASSGGLNRKPVAGGPPPPFMQFTRFVSARYVASRPLSAAARLSASAAASRYEAEMEAAGGDGGGLSTVAE